MKKIDNEFRIGLVLYGGVSLCIYMFGVVYELLRFVRDEDGIYAELKNKKRVKAIIDVISGTSAGGINGIFLAKALATGASLEPLKNFWIEQGDILKLIDKGGSPKSLLNSENYRQLLEKAFNMLSEGSDPDKVQDSILDLFVTATDLDGEITEYNFDKDSICKPNLGDIKTKIFGRGFWLKKRLSRNMFQNDEKYLEDHKRTEGRNDFGRIRSSNADNDFNKNEQRINYFFSKIAATTSAFPVAFTPVVFTKDEKEEMQNLFGPGILKSDPQKDSSYADGGLVNNRPFNYALKSIFNHYADTIVHRKLFFVEPDPETVKIEEEEKNKKQKPRILKTDGLDSFLGYFNAAFYQNISDEMDNIIEQREKIKNVDEINNIIYGLMETAKEKGKGKEEGKEKSGDNLCEFDFEEFNFDKFQKNPMFISYRDYKSHRLIDLITEDIYNALIRNEPVSSDEKSKSSDKLRNKESIREFFQKQEENDPFFLKKYDYPFRIRRLRFFIKKINFILKNLGNTDSDLKEILSGYKGKLYNRIEVYNQSVWKLYNRVEVYNQSIRKLNNDPVITWENYKEIVPAKYQGIMNNTNKEETEKIIVEISDNELIKEKYAKVQYWYKEFKIYEYFDMYTYPIILCAGIEDVETLDVVRISPDNATRYIKGNSISEKLTGEKLMHFSAFLKDSWRENDIIWGRLDAAEIIIKSLLEDKNFNEKLNEAQKSEADQKFRDEVKDYLDKICPQIIDEEFKGIFQRRRKEINNIVFSRSLKLKKMKWCGDLLLKCVAEVEGKSANEKEECFKNDYKIGQEELKDVDKNYLIVVGANLLRNLGLLLKTLPGKYDSGLIKKLLKLLEGPLNGISRIFNYLYYLANFLCGELKGFAKRLNVVLITFVVFLFLLKITNLIQVESYWLYAILTFLLTWMVFGKNFLKLLAIILGLILVGIVSVWIFIPDFMVRIMHWLIQVI